MSEYNLFAGVNENFEFPPEIRAALLESLNIRNIGAPMTTAQRNALPTADLDPGYYIFNTDTMSFQVFRPEFLDKPPLPVWHEGLEAPGSVKEWAGTVIPDGWKPQNGENLLRANFVGLFKAIGTTYGGLDTPMHFKIPNRTGRVTVAANASYPLGSQGGEARVTLSINQVPGHQHGGSTTEDVWSHQHGGTTPTNGGHAHTSFEPEVGDNANLQGNSTIYRNRKLAYTQDTGNHAHDFATDWREHRHSHTFATDWRGGGENHENMQPYHAAHLIIKY